ncbi:MAG: elongation factor G [Calditrichaeota bacterium]|nr:MAG: elongation factor G [Calditrichota bacterium]
MREFAINEVRNITLVGHATTGKTSFSEAMLFSAGEIKRLGSVNEGTTTSDYHSDEIERKISISTSILHCEWKNHKINILDTPGYSDFIGEAKGTLRVVDLAAIILNAVSGVEVGTETVWKMAEEYACPRVFIVNLLDKEHADFDKAIAVAKERFGNKVIPVQFPVNQGERFDSVVDILHMKMLKFETNGSGKFTMQEIPSDLQSKADQLRESLIEMAAESDDELLEKFFENGDLTDDELKSGIRTGLLNKSIFPVFCSAATKNIGAQPFMDFLVEYAPSPADRPAEIGVKPGSEEEVKRECKIDAPMSALVFKTISEAHIGELSFFRVFSGKLSSGTEVLNTSRNVTEKIGQLFLMNGKNRKEIGYINAGDIGATVKLKDTHTGNTLSDRRDPVVLKGIDFPEPVIRIAVEPKSKGDEEKISTGLHSLHEEDPTFVVQYDPELRQTIVSGQGELHLDIIIKRLKEKFGVDVNLVEPKIPYRETIRGKSQAQGKYKKQTGGRGQYGDVWLRIEPLPRGGGFEFVDAIVGGVVPSKYIPAVEKGIREAMEEGVIAGYKVTDIKVTLYDGSYHPVDSSDMAFKIAGSLAFKKAFKEAKPVILEPIYDVEVVVPEEFMGDVMGDISSRRGKILGMEAEGPFQVIKAKVPLAELYRYSTTLRSLTQGRGIHRRKFSHYEEVPNEIAQKLIAAAEEEKSK